MGHSKKRKEDARFIQGKGNYVDDVKLPGMLYMDIVRSPYAYAKIKNIDASKALEIPGVVAVVTGKDLEQYNLHWMPTLMSDTQMVLPTDTVMYQAQEVAAALGVDLRVVAVVSSVVDEEAQPPVVRGIAGPGIRAHAHRAPLAPIPTPPRKSSFSGW